MVRDRVIAAFLQTQANAPQLVTRSTLVEMTGVPLETCRRIIADGDGHDFLLVRDDATGCMVAQYGEEADELTARIKRDMATLQEIADSKPLAWVEQEED